MTKPAAPKVRQAIDAMQPYAPPTSGRDGMLRLDFNENTVGCSPRVVEKLRQAATADFLTVYPEYESARSEMAGFFGVGTDEITFSDGTDEGIHVVLQTFVNPGDEVLIPAPAFPMFKFYAQVADAKPVLVPYPEADLTFPLEALLSAISPRTGAIIIANPNNPTGTAIDLATIERVLQKASGVAVLIDEAYFEFYGEPLSSSWQAIPTSSSAAPFRKPTALPGCASAAFSRRPRTWPRCAKASRPTASPH